MAAYGNMDQGRPGLIYGNEPRKVDTGIASVAINYGAPVFRTVGTPNAVTPVWNTSTANIFAGIAALTQKEPGGYVAQESVDIVNRGEIWVSIEGTVTSDSPVYWDFTNSLFTVTSAGNHLIPNARFVTNGNSQNLAVISVDGAQLVS